MTRTAIALPALPKGRYTTRPLKRSGRRGVWLRGRWVQPEEWTVGRGVARKTVGPGGRLNVLATDRDGGIWQETVDVVSSHARYGNTVMLLCAAVEGRRQFVVQGSPPKKKKARKSPRKSHEEPAILVDIP